MNLKCRKNSYGNLQLHVTNEQYSKADNVTCIPVWNTYLGEHL